MKIIIEASNVAELEILLKQIMGGTKTVVDRHVRDLALTIRTKNILANAKIETVGQLAAMSDHDLLMLPNAGRRFVDDIRGALSELKPISNAA